MRTKNGPHFKVTPRTMMYDHTLARARIYSTILYRRAHQLDLRLRRLTDVPRTLIHQISLLRGNASGMYLQDSQTHVHDHALQSLFVNIPRFAYVQISENRRVEDAAWFPLSYQHQTQIPN